MIGVVPEHELERPVGLGLRHLPECGPAKKGAAAFVSGAAEWSARYHAANDSSERVLKPRIAAAKGPGEENHGDRLDTTHHEGIHVPRNHSPGPPARSRARGRRQAGPPDGRPQRPLPRGRYGELSA